MLSVFVVNWRWSELAGKFSLWVRVRSMSIVAGSEGSYVPDIFLADVIAVFFVVLADAGLVALL